MVSKSKSFPESRFFYNGFTKFIAILKVFPRNVIFFEAIRINRISNVEFLDATVFEIVFPVEIFERIILKSTFSEFIRLEVVSTAGHN